MLVRLVKCRSAASPSRLPGLDWAINPYRGCSHACSYCYAQDVTRFETDRPWGDVVDVKTNIVAQLKKELEKGARGVYGIGTVTDPYQPAEKECELTRGCLALLKRFDAHISILTKSDLVLRDMDLLRDWEGAEVGISIGCADDRVASVIEAGAPPPSRRFEVLSELSSAKIRTYLMAAPVIRGVCDSEAALKELVSRAARAGASSVMWDKLNHKPLASSRLKLALVAGGFQSCGYHTPEDAKRIRTILARACETNGIHLEDAF
jgi:DNA repair photolyase